ncbi:MAG: hypothetical protein ACT4PT_04900 [Methanobacteriota archaeon]
MKDLTTIPLTKPTRDRLRKMGAKGETYEEILVRVLDSYDEVHAEVAVGGRKKGKGFVPLEPLEE